MANPNQVQLDPLKYLSTIPQFNGKRDDLINFCRLVDRIHPILRTYDEFSQLFFSDIIKSRLIGKAKEIIEINTQAQSWTEIKSILENNFGEKKNCEQLFDELRSVTFNNTTVDFYNDILYRLRRLNNKALLVLGEGEAANQVTINNRRSALHIFKNKMPEPMRTVLTCRNPDSLEAAMDILFESGYSHMGKNGQIIKKKQNETQNSSNHKTDGTRKNTYNNRSNDHNNHQRENYNSRQNNQPNRNNGQNHDHSQQPEPMEINNAQNFQPTASTETYHI